MTKRYLGNIITQNPTAPAGPYQDGAASGVWSLAEAFAYSKAGLWPIAGNEAPLSGDIGVFAGGRSSSGATETIEYISIASDGNGSSWGNLSGGYAPNKNFALSNSTRGIIGGGENEGGASPFYRTDMQYITIVTKGSTTDFGTLSTNTQRGGGGLANSTRGVFTRGGDGSNVISYVTIASTGNDTDFGDLTQTAKFMINGCGSTTRGLFQLSYTSAYANNIEYITIASTGNATDFGDRTVAGIASLLSSSTRSVMGAGGGTASNVIDYVTTASTGNATDFGDLATAQYYACAVSNSTKGVIGSGFNGTFIKALEKITIASTGNATSFGNLSVSRSNCGGGMSNSHGGL